LLVKNHHLLYHSATRPIFHPQHFNQEIMTLNVYDFENFPRGKLPAYLTRRQFFSGLIHEIRAYSQQGEHPYYRLCDLGEMPNSELGRAVPVPLPGSEIFTENGYIWGKAAEAKNAVRLFPADSPACYVLQQFNSENSIVDASRKLTVRTDWDKQRAFAFVRGVFLWLVLAKLYIPKE
jgi:hypothetical protein